MCVLKVWKVLILSNISSLRSLVNNGWTIANRRGVVSKIGKDNFQEVSQLANQANFTDTLTFSKAKDYLSAENLENTKKTINNVIQSYKEYARCPYINEYLRSGAELSEKSKNLLENLKLAILNNKVTGEFVRGLTPNRKNKLENIDDVSKFVFENKGFTSATPKINSDYANCFALGTNGSKVIFDLKDFPGYKANNYEVIFDTNAFTKDKFKIVQDGERLYRVIQK